MATNRLEILEGMLEADSNNSFARYGLAMELARLSRLDDAAREFDRLLQSDRDYVAGYFHAGQNYEKLGDVESARRMYSEGIAAAGRKGDGHTRAELEAALSLLPV